MHSKKETNSIALADMSKIQMSVVTDIYAKKQAKYDAKLTVCFIMGCGSEISKRLMRAFPVGWVVMYDLVDDVVLVVTNRKTVELTGVQANDIATSLDGGGAVCNAAAQGKSEYLQYGVHMLLNRVVDAIDRTEKTGVADIPIDECCPDI